MAQRVNYSELAATIAQELGIYWAATVEAKFTVTNSWYTGNWVWVTSSFPGYHSSPYAGRVRLDPFAPETMSLARDFLSFLAKESELTIPDLADDDPLFRLIAEIVSNDDAADCFFEALTGQVVEEEFNLRAALDTLQAEALLPGAEAWKPVEVEGRGQLAQLLDKLATNGVLRSAAEIKLREYRWQYVIHDHRHYLLFGQNEQRITPKAWFDAAWKFIQHFRCNFGMFITEAMLYDKVTIIGADNAPVSISKEDQEFLAEYSGRIVQCIEKEDGTVEEVREPWRQVERLNVVNAKQLYKLLEGRIEQGVCFEGGEIYP
jgi:hypothetical protein